MLQKNPRPSFPEGIARPAVRGLRASSSASSSRLADIATVRALTMHSTISPSCPGLGMPRAARNVASSAKGIAKTVCGDLDVVREQRQLRGDAVVRGSWHGRLARAPQKRLALIALQHIDLTLRPRPSHFRMHGRAAHATALHRRPVCHRSMSSSTVSRCGAHLVAKLCGTPIKSSSFPATKSTISPTLAGLR